MVETASVDNDQLGFNAASATVPEGFVPCVLQAGLGQLYAWDGAVAGGRARDVPSIEEVVDAVAGEDVLDAFVGRIESRPVKELLRSAGDSAAQLALIAAVGLHALIRIDLSGGGGGPSAAGDVRSLLTMHQATTLGRSWRVDFGGDDAIQGHAVEVGSTHSPQPFRISVAKPDSRPADPPADADLQAALRWAFATSPLGVEGLSTAAVHFKSVLARDFDSTEPWHQQFHPIAVVVGLLLYLAGFGGRSGSRVAPRYLDIACWTFGAKAHGQVTLNRRDIVDLQHGGDPSRAASVRLQERLRVVVGEGSPHGLIIWFRSLLRWHGTDGEELGTAPATHGLGVSITAVHKHTGRGVFVWPRICNTARHFGGASKPLTICVLMVCVVTPTPAVSVCRQRRHCCSSPQGRHGDTLSIWRHPVCGVWRDRALVAGESARRLASPCVTI